MHKRNVPINVWIIRLVRCRLPPIARHTSSLYNRPGSRLPGCTNWICPVVKPTNSGALSLTAKASLKSWQLGFVPLYNFLSIGLQRSAFWKRIQTEIIDDEITGRTKVRTEKQQQQCILNVRNDRIEWNGQNWSILDSNGWPEGDINSWHEYMTGCWSTYQM